VVSIRTSDLQNFRKRENPNPTEKFSTDFVTGATKPSVIASTGFDNLDSFDEEVLVCTSLSGRSSVLYDRKTSDITG
jgi:hypothetical protein